MKHYFCLLFFFHSVLSFAQVSEIDSLLASLKTQQDSTKKINTLIELTEALLGQGDYESALKYGTEALLLNDKVLLSSKGESLNRAKLIKADVLNTLGIVYDEKGNYDKALEYYFSNLRLREEIGDKKGEAAAYNNIGIVHEEKEDFVKALEYYFTSLKIKENINDIKGIAASYNNIAGVYSQQNDYDKALKFHFDALKIREQGGVKKELAASYNNIGIFMLKKTTSAKPLSFIPKVLKLINSLEISVDWQALI